MVSIVHARIGSVVGHDCGVPDFSGLVEPEDIVATTIKD